jgi:ubiquinone/menaquinone biosynthesis C-methylase UbiE
MRTATAQAWVYLADSRTMAETPSETIALVVTSPPYWHIKDYGVPHQIGYGQSLHEYLYDLSRVWKECWRVLKPGRRLCINEATHKVVALRNNGNHTPVLLTDSGLTVSLLGIVVPPHLQGQAWDYLNRYVVGKRVLLRFDPLRGASETPTPAYLYLTNRLFVNRKMIEMGLARADRSRGYRYRERFIAAEGK